jgi:hypothetical protein
MWFCGWRPARRGWSWWCGCSASCRWSSPSPRALPASRRARGELCPRLTLRGPCSCWRCCAASLAAKRAAGVSAAGGVSAGRCQLAGLGSSLARSAARTNARVGATRQASRQAGSREALVPPKLVFERWQPLRKLITLHGTLSAIPAAALARAACCEGAKLRKAVPAIARETAGSPTRSRSRIANPRRLADRLCTLPLASRDIDR